MSSSRLPAQTLAPVLTLRLNLLSRPELSPLLQSLLWSSAVKWRHITAALSSASTRVQQEYWPAFVQFQVTFLHLLDFTIFSHSGLTSYSCFLCRAQAHKPIDCRWRQTLRNLSPSSCLQTEMNANQCDGGWRKCIRALFVTILSLFCCLLNLNLNVGEFIVLLPSHHF